MSQQANLGVCGRDRRSQPAQGGGFTLIEVMVALIVISVGLLGIAGMQGLALSSAGNARMRSLASIEAASMAAAMHTNRDFWSVTVGTWTVSGTTFTDSSGLLTAGTDCTSAGAVPCAPAAVASYDLQNWANALSAVLPSPQATISCPNGTPPMSCTITIQWAENAVSLSQSQAAAAQAAQSSGTPSAFQNNTYTLYLQP